ncbi:hypothetical protein DMP23_47635 [Amycolatopsis sp. A1MSW2902]|uniref:hypothetical protein n=1 Tax=Amycolatopsis sp. A1MSW2902 TaxID=687413 RepID=UPI00307E8CBD
MSEDQDVGRAAAPRRRAPRKPQVPAPGHTRIAWYWRLPDFDDARAAYLADWQCDERERIRGPEKFAAWIGRALSRFAELTPQERAARVERPPAEGITGGSRSFEVPDGDLAAMRKAMREDREAGLWTSDSGWVAGAIATAVEAARTRAGGTLPTPPTRLASSYRHRFDES